MENQKYTQLKRKAISLAKSIYPSQSPSKKPKKAKKEILDCYYTIDVRGMDDEGEILSESDTACLIPKEKIDEDPVASRIFTAFLEYDDTPIMGSFRAAPKTLSREEILFGYIYLFGYTMNFGCTETDYEKLRRFIKEHYSLENAIVINERIQIISTPYAQFGLFDIDGQRKFQEMRKKPYISCGHAKFFVATPLDDDGGSCDYNDNFLEYWS